MSIIEAHAYDITIKDDALNEEGDPQTKIILHCLNKESNPVTIIVDDFPVFCKIELPTTIDKYGNIMDWNYESCQDIINIMKKVLTKKEIDHFKKWKFFRGHKLYYYNGERKYPFILMVFNTVKQMHTISKVCRFIYTPNGKIELKYHETEVDLHNKMFSMKDLGCTEKFICEGREIFIDDEERISKPGPSWRPLKEYVVSWKTFKKLPENSKIWFSYPIICSWDIETYSHNHRCFPQKHHYEDCIFSISLTFQTYMKPKTRKDIIIIIGPTTPREDVIVYNVKNEDEVIEKFFDLIVEEDPDVFIGYNIYGFDYDYIDTRLIDVGKTWRNIGRTYEDECVMKNISWNSSAYGFQKLNFLNCAGRISVDMLPYIKRDHKLPMYNLNSVSKYFLGENKVDLKPHEMFEIHKKFIDLEDELNQIVGTDDYSNFIELYKKLPDSQQEKFKDLLDSNDKIIEYNVQDSVLVIRLFEKLNVWISLIELSSIVRVTPIDVFTRGQQVRCIAQLYHAASNKNIVLTKREKDYVFFNGGKVEDPIVGFWDLVLCFDFSSLYPSIMIAYNICFTTLMYKNNLLEDQKVNKFDISQEEPIDAKPPSDDNFDYGEYAEDYTGEPASKEKVKKNYHFEFVKSDVKKGLLPEILENLLNNRKRVKKQKKTIGKLITAIDNELWIPLKSNKNMKFKDIKNNEVLKKIQSLIPDLDLDSKIMDYHSIIEKEFFSMKVTETLYDSRQLGLKVSANSLYGFLGAQVRGKYSLIEGSMSVTSRGRELITDASEFFEKEYGATTVYGDTDSTMVHVPSLEDDPKKAWDMADVMEKHINGTKAVYDADGVLIKEEVKGIFPPPLNLEFEKAMRALFMKKKHYAYMTYGPDGSIEKEKNSDVNQLNVKGIVLARRDNCKLIRNTYENMIRSIFAGKDINYIFNIIIKAVIDVIELKFNITENLSIVKSMGSNYKSKTFALAVFSEEMKIVRRPVNPGERFPYVVVNDHKKRDKLGYKMRTVELFLEQWESSGYKYGDSIPEDFKSPIGLYPPESIDSVYYINNVLTNPIDKLFECAFQRIIEKYEPHVYTPIHNTRLKPVCVKTPLKMISLIIKDHKKLIDKEGIMAIYDEIAKLPQWFEKL